MGDSITEGGCASKAENQYVSLIAAQTGAVCRNYGIGGTNTVENGAYAGKSLDEVLKHWGYEEKFPVLIKLIDAKDRLSVQVHPDNTYALENEGEYGKPKCGMWLTARRAHS